MVFNGKIDRIFWIGCFIASNACVLIAILCLDDIPASIWGIVIGLDVFFSVFVITLKYLINKKDLKKYHEAVLELRKISVFINELQLEHICMSGCVFDENGQLFRADRDGCPLPLPAGHQIILNKKGFPIELDEYGQEIKEPTSKHFNLVVFMSVFVTLAVIGAFVVLCMFIPWVGVSLFIIFLLVIFFGVLYKTRNKCKKKSH